MDGRQRREAATAASPGKKRWGSARRDLAFRTREISMLVVARLASKVLRGSCLVITAGY